MQALLGDIAAGVLVNVITATGRWIATSVTSGRAGRDGDIAAWFDTYELTDRAFPDLGIPGVAAAAAGAWLDGDEVHAVLHELLATRLTDAPEADVERLRGALRELAWTEFARLKTSADGRLPIVRFTPEFTRYVTDLIADRFFDWADGEICELVGRFEARDPEWWRQVRADAFGARITAVLHAIDRHITALDDRPDPAADTEWAARYRRQARQAYGTIEPPDFARRRKVPIGDLYVPPDIVEPGAARDAGGNPTTIGFDELAGRIDRTVLLGDPGGGKSTASRVLAYRWSGDPAAYGAGAPGDRCARPGCGGTFIGGFCEQCGAAQIDSEVGDTPGMSGRSRVPFLVVLRDFAAGDGPRGSVVEHIEERLNTFHQCPAPRGAVERLLLSGGAAVIFDGLDELIDTSRRVEVTRIVEQFCTRFPLAPVLVTSRLVGYDEARLDDEQFGVYRIAGFTRDETAAYVRNWFALEDDTDADVVADAFMRESEQVQDLRANPLMLALMCILYRGEGTLPRNRPGVYAECARMLFDKWDTRRGIHVDLQARNLIEPALRHIAYWLFTRDGSPEVTEAELVARVADLLHERGFEHRHDAEAAAGEFVAFLRGRGWILGDAGTTARGEPLYTFTHRTFLEYFAAAHLASTHDTPGKLARALAPRVAKGEWDVVGQLAVQLKDAATDRGAEQILTTLINDRRRTSADAQMHLVAFAARCLDVAEVPPALVRQIANKAFDQLREDANHALTYLPLWRDRVGEIIADVLSERVASLMASEDPGARRLGGRFSVYATFCAARNANSAYWHRLERRLTAEHRDTLMEMARTDDTILMRLIDRGVITLAEALRLREHRIDVLLREISVPFTEVTWWPYTLQAIREFVDMPHAPDHLNPDPDAGVSRLLEFGAALEELPAPPWVVTPPARWVARLGVLGSLRDVPGRESGGFLAAVVLLILEAELAAEMHSLARLRTSFWEPQEYLDRFLNATGTVLADLPLRGSFRRALDRTAAGEPGFVQWQDADEPE